MSERYTRLYALNKPLYLQSAPLMVVAGALLLDAETDSVVAQLKFKNISKSVIKAIKVYVQPLTTTGMPLGNWVEHQYLDLEVYRDGEFGQREAVVLPDNTTRQFVVKVDEVIFSDNSIWRSEGQDWPYFALPIDLSTAFKGNKDLIDQYRIEYGDSSVNLPQKSGVLWYCSCSSINMEDEYTCHNCGKERKTLFSFDIHDFIQRKDDRLKSTAANLIKENTVESVAEAKNVLSRVSGMSGSRVFSELDKRLEHLKKEEIRKKKKKRNRIIGFIFLLLLILAAGFFYFTYFLPGINYKKAIKQLDDGHYENAATLFTNLENYKDAPWLVTFSAFMDSIDNEEYDNAISHLNSTISEISEMDDSQHYYDILYKKAVDLLSVESYMATDLSRKIFTKLGDYKDSKEYFNHFHSVIKSINHETYHGSDTDKYCFELTYKSGIIDSITERRGKIKIGNLEYDEQCRITSFLIGGNQVEVTYDSNKHVIKKRFNDTNTTVEYDEYGNSITCFLNDFGNIQYKLNDDNTPISGYAPINKTNGLGDEVKGLYLKYYYSYANNGSLDSKEIWASLYEDKLFTIFSEIEFTYSYIYVDSNTYDDSILMRNMSILGILGQ